MCEYLVGVADCLPGVRMMFQATTIKKCKLITRSIPVLHEKILRRLADNFYPATKLAESQYVTVKDHFSLLH